MLIRSQVFVDAKRRLLVNEHTRLALVVHYDGIISVLLRDQQLAHSNISHTVSALEKCLTIKLARRA